MNGELVVGEFHPAASFAFRYIKSLPVEELMIWNEAFASNAIEGNRMAEICSETLNRILTGQPVSDRYVLGLAWMLRVESEAEK